MSRGRRRRGPTATHTQPGLPRPRLVRGGLAVAAAALLTGCSIEGTVEIGLKDVRVDLIAEQTFADPGELRPNLCGDYFSDLWSQSGLTRDPVTPQVAENVACRLHGTMPIEALPFDLMHANGMTYMTVPGTGSYALTPDPTDRVDVTITTPGEIIAASVPGATGRVLRLTDAHVAMSKQVQVVARDEGLDPRWWWLAPGVPVAALTGAAAVLGARRVSAAIQAEEARRRGREAEESERMAGTEATEDDRGVPTELHRPARPTAEPPQDPSIWAPD